MFVHSICLALVAMAMCFLALSSAFPFTKGHTVNGLVAGTSGTSGILRYNWLFGVSKC